MRSTDAAAFSCPACGAVMVEGSHREHQQSLVPAHRLAHRDDHDRQPAVCVDALRGPDAERDRVGAVRHSGGVHALHPVPDLGAAARWLAGRPPRSALVHHGGRRAVRPRLGRDGVRDVVADALRDVLRGRHGCGVRLQLLHRVRAQVVQGAARTGRGHHGRGLWRRNGALHSGHFVTHRLERLPGRHSWSRACFKAWSSCSSRRS